MLSSCLSKVAWCWRARISVGARSAACAPDSIAVSIDINATSVLPDPTSPWRRRSIGAVCARHDVWIVSDEVYATLTYGNHVFASPFDNPDLADRTVVVSSISKSHAVPGLRCGWIAAPEEFCAKAVPISETMLFGSQPFLEDATAFALDNHFPELGAMKRGYERRARTLVAGLKPAKTVSARMPEGGMFVMVDVRRTGLTGEQFARRLLDEENVVTMPGESFGAGGAGHLRVALTVDEKQIGEACRRIAALASRL